MEKEKINFQHKDGTVEGVYINAADASPLVIIINGHNGFYNYGMFPYIQQKLYEKSISSYSFNFSHGGVRGEADQFEDLEKYEQNCMRLETEDVVCVLHSLNNQFKKHSRVYLLAHSLGGVPTIFATKTAIEEKLNVAGIILVSTVKTLNFWSPEIIREWALAGVYYQKNNRTKQELPQGFEFLQEILKSEKEWNVKKGIQSLGIPILIIHGANDEAVSVEHGESLYSWITNLNPHSSFKIVENATHTFNTKHPFEKTSIELEELIKITVDWIFTHNT